MLWKSPWVHLGAYKKAPEISYLGDLKAKRRTIGQKEKMIKDLPVINVNCLLHEEECHCE